MTILYKICLFEDRLEKHGKCPIADSIFKLVFTCLTSVLTQMSTEDEIIFFCDGADYVDKLKMICDKCNVKYKLFTFNYKSASKIHYESTKYINSNETHDQIYVCEDDYLHFDGSLDKIKEFLNKYSKYFCHPIDYPNLYESNSRFVYDSEIILTNTHHWRSIKSTTYTIAFTKSLYKEHIRTFDIIKDYVYDEHGVNLLYIFNKCFSPIPSLSSHLTNGCLPYIVDTQKVYDKNYNKFIQSSS
jgi:hypothetical protein